MRERREKNNFKERSSSFSLRFMEIELRSTHRELSVRTKILEFRQTQRGRKVSYLEYF